MVNKGKIYNKLKKIISGIIVFAMVLQVFYFSPNTVEATLTKRPTPTQVSQIKTYSEENPTEYFIVRTPLDEKNVIYVEGKTEESTKMLCIRMKKYKGSTYLMTVFVTPNENGEFSIKVDLTKGNTNIPDVIDGKGEVAPKEESFDTRPGYKAVETISSGTYVLTIAKTSEEPTRGDDGRIKVADDAFLGGNRGYALDSAVLTVGSANNPKLVKYSSVITNNDNTRKKIEPNSTTDSSYKSSHVRYTDKKLRDMAFVLNNPKTGKEESMTDKKVTYITNLAKKITQDASTDYEKVFKIYEYVAKNIYYDNYAFQTKKNQYANPYRNLYNLEEKVKSENSTSNGKVATVCQGYSAMVIAMARTLDIPARLVNGRHISPPTELWTDKSDSDVKRLTHWWVEAYVDGRWIIIDANAGSPNKWNRTSFSASGTWTPKGCINYTYFDISKELLSISHGYNTVYPGATDGKYLSNAAEVKQLKSFLNTKSSGKTNGKRLNSKYSANDFSTWGAGTVSSFETNGYGRTYRIAWSKKNLSGKLNLANFSALKYLSVSSNNITSIDLTGCSALTSIYAGYNKITTFDSTASSKVTFINLQGNKKLKSVKFKHGSKKITISTNYESGNFGLQYKKSASKKVTIYANNKIKGYKYLGIYTSSGKKLSSKATYSFYPSKSKYIVKYKKK